MAIIDKPSNFFDTSLWTANGSAKTISGVGFQPDLLWAKCRSNTYSHIWVDSVRGITKQISSNTDALETTNAQGVTAFNSEGYVLGTQNEFANNGNTFVGWSWKAGTSVSGNTSGSGAAKAYTGSVNTDAGFSIIRYLGNDSAGHTIPHHLGAVPKMIIGHGLTGSDTTSWTVYHHALGNTKTISLNETAAASTSSVWNDTTPTSSVVSLGSSGNVNDEDDAFILYSFAEKTGFNKFGSYIGNGDANGTFVYTGFKPAFVMIKSSSNAGQAWVMQDNKRDGFNYNNHRLFANSNATEESTVRMDLLSNGFKCRDNDGNGNGFKYIYMAFAENPFVASNFVSATAR